MTALKHRVSCDLRATFGKNMKPAPGCFWRTGVLHGKADFGMNRAVFPGMGTKYGVEKMMRLIKRPTSLIAATLAVTMGIALPANALAADLTGAYAQCVAAGNADLIQIDNRSVLQEQIDQRFNHSVEVAASEGYISSTRPTFIWASETKVACGKAIGYLKSSTIDAQYINKCECFYDRMVQYLN